MFYIMKYTTVILCFGSLISIEILCTSFNQRVLIVRYFYIKNINSQKNNQKKAVKTKKLMSVFLQKKTTALLKYGCCSYPLRENPMILRVC